MHTDQTLDDEFGNFGDIHCLDWAGGAVWQCVLAGSVPVKRLHHRVLKPVLITLNNILWIVKITALMNY